MSLSANISEKAALIWAIADKLTGVYKPHEYGEVILPLTVIRRFDCILADTKDAVLEKFETVKNLPMRDVLLRNVSGKAFYNTSKYTFERLLDDPDNIEANFRDYLNGFSENVQDILEKFKFDGQITTMANKGILYIVIKEFTTPKANLHPDIISNLEMGYIFEEIIRRFSESHNEDAGQHYTPREVIQLMVNILFYDDNDVLSGNNVAKTIYDPACGTGGMLSVAEEYLHKLNASTELMAFGQEINDQTLGNKRNDIPENAIEEITKLYGDFTESEISKIFDTTDFGFTKITVERPLKDENGQLVLKKGKPQPDTSLRDTENVPLKEDIQEYFEREVLPFEPDAWIDEKKSKVGYEIPFTRYFYKYEAPRPSAEIMKEILEIEKELEGALAEVFDL